MKLPPPNNPNVQYVEFFQYCPGYSVLRRGLVFTVSLTTTKTNMGLDDFCIKKQTNLLDKYGAKPLWNSGFRKLEYM